MRKHTKDEGLYGKFKKLAFLSEIKNPAFLFNRDQPFFQDQWLNKYENHYLENFKNKEGFHVNHAK